MVTYSKSSLNKEEDAIFKIRVKYDLNPKREYDQFFATALSTVEKAKMLIDQGLVEGKNIALIGDDDLVSIALAQMSPNFNKLRVYEIDSNYFELNREDCRRVWFKGNYNKTARC